VFASAPDDLIVVRVTTDRPGGLRLRVALGSPHRHREQHRLAAHTLALTGRAPVHVSPTHHPDAEPVGYRTNAGIRYAVAVRALVDAGEVTAEEGAIGIAGAGEATLLVAAHTSFRGWDSPPGDDPGELLDRCAATLDAAAGYPAGDLLARHERDHGALFDRVRLDLGGSAVGRDRGAEPTDERLAALRAGADDPGLAALMFHYGRYLLIASSRPGSQAANLQGIWNELVQPPWSGNYTSNINLQMNYWPAQVTNLPECHLPLVDLVEQLAASGARTARSLYDCAGWTAHHNVDIWRTSWPVGEGTGDPMWALWPMAGAWLSRHLVEHADYAGDEAFRAAHAWPVLRGAAEFVLDYLVPDATGRLVAAPSTSPENAFLDERGRRAALDATATMDIWLIRDLFRDAITASFAAGSTDENFRVRLREALERLPGPVIGADGRLREWSGPFPEVEPGHRHLSHLYALYPGDEIDVRDTPQLAGAARASLRHRLAAGGGSTGWSRAWAIALWARLGDGAAAEESVRELLREYAAPNLFGLHPPRLFQIDGNLGFTAAVAELLMQSHRGRIRLLPALPPAWPTGRVRGLRARGEVLVDLSWAGGHLRQATLTARNDRQVELVPPDTVAGPSRVELRAGVPEVITFTPADRTAASRSTCPWRHRNA
jgi:alpha-L-fucosidase 2